MGGMMSGMSSMGGASGGASSGGAMSSLSQMLPMLNKKKKEDEELAPKKSSGGFQDSAESMDQMGQAFNNIADSEFAATEEYNKQRAQGLPEPMEVDLQEVEPVSDPDTLDASKPEEDDESKSAFVNALKGLMG